MLVHMLRRAYILILCRVGMAPAWEGSPNLEQSVLPVSACAMRCAARVWRIT